MGASVELGVEEVLDLYAAAKNRHDVKAAVALCHADCYYESAGLPGRIEGHQALTAFYTSFFDLLPDYTAEFDGRVVAGDNAVVWGHFTGTVARPIFEGAPVGRTVNVPVTFVCTVRDGLITSDVGYFDVDTMYRQAGLPIPTIDATTRAASFMARFSDCWASKEPEAFRSILHPDTLNLYPGMDEAVGPDGVVEWIKAGIDALPDLSLKVDRWATDGESVILVFEASATVGGKPMVWQGADRFMLEGERIINGRSFFDTRPIAEAMENAAG